VSYSYVQYTGNGTLANYTFPFQYLSADHVKVKVDGVTAIYSLLNANTVTITPTPALGSIIEIRRVTPKENTIVNFTDGSVLLERDLDLLAKFDLYIAQEAADAVEDTISKDALGRWDGQALRLGNISPAINGDEVVIKETLDYEYPAVALVASERENIAIVGSDLGAETTGNSDLGLITEAVDSTPAEGTSRIVVVATNIDAVNTVAESIEDIRDSMTYYGATPPTSPRDYKRWVSSDDGREYMWLNDGDSSQWVEIGAALTPGVVSDGIVTDASVSTESKLYNRISETVSLRDFGAVGDYTTDDSDAIELALAYVSSTGATLFVPRGVYRHSRSFDLPADLVLYGEGATKIAHFPQVGGDKSKLRPGYKHKIGGSVFIFDGTADKTYTTNRSDRYSSFSYVWGYRNYSGFDIRDVSFILDCDVYTSGGVLTTAANDNKSIAGSIFVNNGTLGSFQNVTMFGYTSNAAYVCHNQTGGTTYDNDYIQFSGNSLISGGVAIIGHDSAAGASTEGLTGNRFVGAGIYGGDHHYRPDGDYTRPAIYIDGHMGTSEQDGIRGHTFTACNIRTYANSSILTDNCNDISFVNCVYEFPALAGVANADTTGGFVGTTGTKRFRVFGAAATDAAKMFTYLSSITGPWQCIGAGGYDDATFGYQGNFIRLQASATQSNVQFGSDLSTTVGGWKIERVVSTGELSFKLDGASKSTMYSDGRFQPDVSAPKKNRWERSSLVMSGGAITVTRSYHSVTAGTGAAFNVETINGGTLGDTLYLQAGLTAEPMTLKITGGNIRGAADKVVSGFTRALLVYDGSFWVIY